MAPGATTAEQWIKPGANDSMNTLGVFADEKAGHAVGVLEQSVGVRRETAGRRETGGAEGVRPQDWGRRRAAGRCRAKSLFATTWSWGADGAVYVAESFQPHILKLAPGEASLEVWATDPKFSGGEGPGLDGIAIGAGWQPLRQYIRDRTAVPRRDAAKAAKRAGSRSSRPRRGFEHPDGMRAYGKNGLLVVEGADAGRFDIIEVNGDNAEVKTVKGGFKQPVSVWQIGQTAWVLEGQLGTLFDPPEKRGKPGPFHAYAVELPK